MDTCGFLFEIVEHSTMTEIASQTRQLGAAIGAVLVVLGIAAYVISDFASLTALIPTALGIALVLLGLVGRKPSRLQQSIYGMGVIALAGVLGSLRGIPDILSLVTGDEVDSVVATVSQAVIIVLCFVLLVGIARYVLSSR